MKISGTKINVKGLFVRKHNSTLDTEAICCMQLGHKSIHYSPMYFCYAIMINTLSFYVVRRHCAMNSFMKLKWRCSNCILVITHIMFPAWWCLCTLGKNGNTIFTSPLSTKRCFPFLPPGHCLNNCRCIIDRHPYNNNVWNWSCIFVRWTDVIYLWYFNTMYNISMCPAIIS